MRRLIVTTYGRQLALKFSTQAISSQVINGTGFRHVIS